MLPCHLITDAADQWCCLLRVAAASAFSAKLGRLTWVPPSLGTVSPDGCVSGWRHRGQAALR
jgi:hypothetical protein